MSKYFLDFGTQHGSGLYKICALEDFDQNVEIHSFEANPYTFKADVWKKAIDKRPDLKDTKAHCEKMVHYYNIGVSGDTGFYHFNCEERSRRRVYREWLFSFRPFLLEYRKKL